MQIAILSFYSGQVQRGVENWTSEIAKRLSGKNQVTVFQNGKNTPAGFETVVRGIDIDWNKTDSTVSPLRRFFLDYWSLKIALWTLKQIPQILKNKYDIVIPTNGGWQVALIRFATWLYGGKMVVVGHSGRGWDERNNLWSFPDAFVSLSEYNRDWAKKVNPLVKVKVIPNGVDLDKFSEKGSKAEVDLPRPLILCVAAPQSGKGLNYVINAVSKLPGCGLLILGSDSKENPAYRSGAKILGKRFMMKKVPFSEIPKYYRAADVFTLPSWSNEAFGMVYLEAMASGLPVVATNDQLRREIIEDAGIFVDPADSQSYRKALEAAIDRKWNGVPRKQAEKFSWDGVTQKYEDLFKEIV